MKKILLINAIVFTMAACGGSNDKPSTPTTSSAATTSSSSVAISSSSKASSVSSAVSSDITLPPANVSSSATSVSSTAGVSSVSSISSVSSVSSASSVSSVLVASSASSVSSSVSSSSSSTSSASSVASSAASSAAGWKLVWSDDFDGTAIDPAKWGFEENCWGGGNNEQQCYTNKADNAFVADGKLNIVVKKESFTGANSPDGTGTATATLPYTSARLRTKNLKEWTYGRFEIRAKLPSGQGSWPAIWMLPTNSPYGTWASSGEIDIMEAVNLKTPTDEANAGGVPEARVYGTLHYGRNWPDNKNSGEPYKIPGGVNPADGFHTYALEWEEGEIRWYVDGVHYQTQRKAGWYSQYLLNNVLVNAPDGAPFDDKAQYHMLLNVAVGGAWAGNVNGTGIDTNIFPITMQVDYVKVYECTASPSTGKGCATVDAGAKFNPGNARPSLDFYTPTLPTSTFYTDGLATGLSLDKYSPTNIITATEQTENSRGKILTVDKQNNEAGNVYFNVGSTKSNFKPWLANGELVFDVRLNSKATGSKLFVKLDSGWPAVSDYEVTLPAVGVWQEIRIPVATIVNHGNTYSAGNKVDLTAITNAFVIEPTDQMNVSFDNIRLEGGAAVVVDPPLTSSFNIFMDAVDPLWDYGIGEYDPDNHVVTSVVDATEPSRGKVLDIAFDATTHNGLAFIQATTTKDASAFASTGSLSFDIKVLSYGTNTGGLVVKADCVNPCSSGDINIGKPGDGVWETVTVPVSTLVTGGLNLSKVNTPFIILPKWGDQNGVHLQLDNIKWVKP